MDGLENDRAAEIRTLLGYSVRSRGPLEASTFRRDSRSGVRDLAVRHGIPAAHPDRKRPRPWANLKPSLEKSKPFHLMKQTGTAFRRAARNPSDPQESPR
jgi:hypothetical protein